MTGNLLIRTAYYYPFAIFYKPLVVWQASLIMLANNGVVQNKNEQNMKKHLLIMTGAVLLMLSACNSENKNNASDSVVTDTTISDTNGTVPIQDTLTTDSITTDTTSTTTGSQMQ